MSMVYDYGQRMPTNWWDNDRLEHFRKLRKAAELFDERTGQPHCEDPTKEEWFQQLIQRLEAIERKLDEKG